MSANCNVLAIRRARPLIQGRGRANTGYGKGTSSCRGEQNRSHPLRSIMGTTCRTSSYNSHESELNLGSRLRARTALLLETSSICPTWPQSTICGEEGFVTGRLRLVEVVEGTVRSLTLGKSPHSTSRRMTSSSESSSSSSSSSSSPSRTRTVNRTAAPCFSASLVHSGWSGGRQECFDNPDKD